MVADISDRTLVENAWVTLRNVPAVDDFIALVQSTSVPLDAATALIANAVRPPVDVGATLLALDDLADQCNQDGGQTLSAELLGRRLFESGGFRGNVVDYHDPENSMIDAVIARRTGLPILLAIVMIEVGRRCSIEVQPVSMPGHFLVYLPTIEQYCDPFHRGELMDSEGCRQRHDAMFRGQRTLADRELEPVGVATVLARVLNNLELSRLGRNASTARSLLRMHAALPDMHPGEQLALGIRLGNIGCFRDAALIAEHAAAQLDGAYALQARVAAAGYWAHTN